MIYITAYRLHRRKDRFQAQAVLTDLYRSTRLFESASFYVLYPINTPFKDSSCLGLSFSVQKKKELL